MSTCAESTRKEDYNLSLHVGALFIILGVSAGACALPILATRIPQLRIPARALFVFRHFGTGVLIATAFVHLFPTAFVNLTNPCLPEFFNETYPALAGVIALGAVFVITVAEMVFSPGRSLCSGPELDTMTTDNPRSSIVLGSAEVGALGLAPGSVDASRSGRKGSLLSTPALAISTSPNTPDITPLETINTFRRLSDDSLDSIEAEKNERERRKLVVQCMLLECGILFHSVFIGMALAVAVGGEQIILLVAIAFHQTFEGLALGSRIAAIGWNSKALQPWFMALAYGCTTPLGQAIGIATRDLYDPDSETGLLVVGICNAISAGLLTYTSLVDLLSEDFLSDASWRTMRGTKRVMASSLVFFGAFCMSLIGAWA